MRRKGFRRGVGVEERYGLAGRGVTHRTIAALCGCARETVTRVLAGGWDRGPTADRIRRAVDLILAEPPEAFVRDREATLIRVARRLEEENRTGEPPLAAVG